MPVSFVNGSFHVGMGYGAALRTNQNPNPIITNSAESTFISSPAIPEPSQDSGLDPVPTPPNPQETEKPTKPERVENVEDLRENIPDYLPLKETPFGKIDYVRAGDPEGQTLLLIPGKFGSWFDYHLLIIELAKMGYDVMAVSQPTHGYSQANRARFDFYGTQPSTYGEFWSYWIRALDLSDVTIVASSFGLGEVVEAVLEQEDLPITGFVSINGYAPEIHQEMIPSIDYDGLLGGRHGPGWFMEKENGMYNNMNHVISSHFTNIGESFMERGEEGERLTMELMRSFPLPDFQTGEFDEGRVHSICVQGAMGFFWTVMGFQSMREEKPSLKFFKDKPFLVIGSHDHFIQGRDDEAPDEPGGFVVDKEGKTYAQRLAASWDPLSDHPVNQTLLIEGAHHMVYVTHPNETADAIDKFMKAVEPKPSTEGEEDSGK